MAEEIERALAAPNVAPVAMPPNLAAALDYAARGWLIFPLHTPENGGCSCRRLDCDAVGKHPRTPHGLKDATREPAKIRECWAHWPAANIGIVTGAASGPVVLDIDPRSGGMDSFGLLLNEHCDLPPCPMVETGGGGRHLYFAYAGIPIRSRSAIREGVDVKGEGGYVVAPPSLHSSGHRYAWIPTHTLDRKPLPPAPAWLANDSSSQSAAVADHIPKGHRNSTLIRLAGAMRRHGAGYQTILAALQRDSSERCDPPLSEDEVERIAHRAARYEVSAGHGSTRAEKSDSKQTQSESGDAVLRDVQTFIERFVVLPPHTGIAIAAWVVATYVSTTFDQFPYLAVTSPVKECGKSRLCEVVALLAANAYSTVGISPAALFRLIDGADEPPSLILDEAEVLTNKSERAEEIRALLNAGNRPDTTVPRCSGNSHEVIHFRVFSPKLISAIGRLPDTLASRSIVISMQRRLPTQTIGRFIRRSIAPEGEALRKRARACVHARRQVIADCFEKTEITFLADREEENWAPLVSVAKAVAPAHVEGLLLAARSLTTQKIASDIDDSLSLRLLADLQRVWPASQEKITSAEVVQRLRAIEDGPWQERELTQPKLARFLRPFGTRPKQVRIGEATCKGYVRDHLQQAWARYLGVQSETEETIV